MGGKSYNNWGQIFRGIFVNDEDRPKFLNILESSHNIYQTKILAYVLIPTTLISSLKPLFDL
ncbi:MAG: hypothetical protein ACUVTN_04955 [Thermodesulfobacteriota bacterium]